MRLPVSAKLDDLDLIQTFGYEHQIRTRTRQHKTRNVIHEVHLSENPENPENLASTSKTRTGRTTSNSEIKETATSQKREKCSEALRNRADFARLTTRT